MVRTQTRVLLTPVMWAVVAIVITAVTAVLAIGGGTPAVGRDIRVWALSHRTTGTQHFFERLTVIAAPNPLLFFALGCSALLIALRRIRAAVVVAVAPLAAMAAYEAGKRVFARVRPSGAGAFG